MKKLKLTRDEFLSFVYRNGYSQIDKEDKRYYINHENNNVILSDNKIELGYGFLRDHVYMMVLSQEEFLSLYERINKLFNKYKDTNTESVKMRDSNDDIIETLILIEPTPSSYYLYEYIDIKLNGRVVVHTRSIEEIKKAIDLNEIQQVQDQMAKEEQLKIILNDMDTLRAKVENLLKENEQPPQEQIKTQEYVVISARGKICKEVSDFSQTLTGTRVDWSFHVHPNGDYYIDKRISTPKEGYRYFSLLNQQPIHSVRRQLLVLPFGWFEDEE